MSSTVLLSEQGAVYTAGCNNSGQLGLGHTEGLLCCGRLQLTSSQTGHCRRWSADYLIFVTFQLGLSTRYSWTMPGTCMQLVGLRTDSLALVSVMMSFGPR